MPPRRSKRAPIRIRMYRVGFGDCFLISLKGDAGAAHILVDCGVHFRGDIQTIEQAVEDIARETDRKLAIVIATHAHQDHVSGFAKCAGQFKSFSIGEVWLPWTEDPADAQATTLRRKQAALAQRLTQHFAATGDNERALVARDFITIVLGTLPDEVSAAIQPAIEEVISTRRTDLMTISILASVWATSSAIEALREALNTAYGVEESRAIWFCRLQSLAFTIIFSICIILVMLVLVIGPVLWSYIRPLLDVPWEWGWFYEALRYFVAVALLYLVCGAALSLAAHPASTAPRDPAGRRGHGRAVGGAREPVLVLSAEPRPFLGDLRQSRRHRHYAVFFYVSALIFIFGAELNSARRRAEAARLRAERAAEREGRSG